MPDPFRSQYRTLTPEESAKIARIKDLASQLYAEMQMPGYDPNTPPPNREMFIARTNLEQSVMWATKALTG